MLSSCPSPPYAFAQLPGTGVVHLFHGVSLPHYAGKNDSGRGRVSLDFRVGIGGVFRVGGGRVRWGGGG